MTQPPSTTTPAPPDTVAARRSARRGFSVSSAAAGPEPTTPDTAAVEPGQPVNPVRPAWLFQGKIAPAFWTVTCIFSLLVNAVLIAALLGLGGQVFQLKSLLENQLIGPLYANFKLMDEASIQTTIPVKSSVPAKFDLPLDTDTIVTLTEDTSLNNATIVRLETGGLVIVNAPADIVLRAGTQLPVHLKLTVPVDQKIPVNLSVKVNIPLNQTDLHAPFVGLQKAVEPYVQQLGKLPGSWAEAVCGKDPNQFCLFLLK